MPMTALCAYNEPDMQQVVEDFSAACENFGFTSNTKKTEVIQKPVPSKPNKNQNVITGSDRLRSVKSSTFLRSDLSVAATAYDEVKNRIAKARAAFGKLRSNVWNRDGPSPATKRKVYRAANIPVLLCQKTWKVYSKHKKQLKQFYISHLCSLFQINWFQMISKRAVLQRKKSKTFHTILGKTR